MKALVLTYDKQVGLAELVVKSYLELWESCPLKFIIPRNDSQSPHFDYLTTQTNVSIIPAQSSIRATMLALLNQVDDNSWIFWCIDDRYPIAIDQRRMQMVLDFILSGAADSLNGIKLIHWREQSDHGHRDIKIGSDKFRFQVPRSAFGFWHHHFLRAKVLKELFQLSKQNNIAETPSALNAFFHNLPIIETFKNTVFPVGEPIIRFGETLIHGVILANACDALARYKCPIPDYKTESRSVLFQTPSSWVEVSTTKKQILHKLRAQKLSNAEPQQSRASHVRRWVRSLLKTEWR